MSRYEVVIRDDVFTIQELERLIRAAKQLFTDGRIYIQKLEGSGESYIAFCADPKQVTGDV